MCMDSFGRYCSAVEGPSCTILTGTGLLPLLRIGASHVLCATCRADRALTAHKRRRHAPGPCQRRTPANRLIQPRNTHLRAASRNMARYGADGMSEQGQPLPVMQRRKRTDAKIAERSADVADAAGDVDGRKARVVACHD